MGRCPYCGQTVRSNYSRQLFIGFGGAPFPWGFPGWGYNVWGGGWGGVHHGWGWGWGHHWRS